MIQKQFTEGVGLMGMERMSIMAPPPSGTSEDEDSEEEEEEEDKKPNKKKHGNKKDGHVVANKNGKGGKGGQDGKGGKGKEKGKGKGKGNPAEMKMKMHLHKKNQDLASKKREIVEAIAALQGDKLAAAVRKDFYLGWTGRMGRHGTHERIMNHKLGL